MITNETCMSYLIESRQVGSVKKYEAFTDYNEKDRVITMGRMSLWTR